MCCLSLLQLIRDLFTKMSGKAPIDFPKPLPLIGYGKVSLGDSISLMDALPELYPGDGIVSEKPERMENYDQACAPTSMRAALLGSFLCSVSL